MQLVKAACLIGLAALVASCSDNVTGSRPAIVSGTVRVRDGAPLAGATVGFFEPVGSAAVRARLSTRAPAKGQTVVVTDDQGRYAIAVSGGRYEVWIGGDAGIMPVQVKELLVSGSHVSLDLSYPGYRVTGMMTHLGLGLAAGSVFVIGATNTARAELADNGAPRFSERTYSLLLPAGTYGFWANPNEGYWGVPRVLFAGIPVSSDTMIDLACDGHFVQGTVTIPGGGVLYDGIVAATAPGASAWNYTDSNGRYGLHLPDGEYEFRVTPPANADTLGILVTSGVVINAPRTLDFMMPPVPPSPVPPPKQ